MIAATAVIAAVIGLCAGSFLNVVVYRVPAHRSIVRPGSACPSCAHELTAIELIPVASWIAQRGCCRNCGDAIGLRYPLIELLTAAMFAAMAVRFRGGPETIAYCVLAAGCVALAVIDLDTRTLPTRVIHVVALLGAAALGFASLAGGDTGRLVGAGAGAAGVGGALAVVWFAAPGGLGFGDVRFGAMLGMFLGWLGLRPVLLAMIVAFGSGAVVGLALIAARRATRRTALPLGPALALGAIVAVLVPYGVA